MEVVSADLCLRNFNQTFKDYVSHRNEEKILEELTTLVESEDEWRRVDADSRDTIDLLMNLYELLQSHSDKPALTWAVLDLLAIILKQSHLQQCIIDNFKFIPVLTKIIEAKPSRDRKIKILQLIQELSYGIKISWPESHLPSLISILTKCMMSEEVGLVPLALGILINLCHRNTPAICILMKSVDIKVFIKFLIKLQNHSVEFKIQVCKFLIVLEEVSGTGLPEGLAETYLRSSCHTLGEALALSNPVLMRHIYLFFKEVLSSFPGSLSLTLSNYPNYAEDIEKLLETAKEKEDLNPDCLSVLFDYLSRVLDLRVFGLEGLYPGMLELASGWLASRSPVSSSALRLISNIISILIAEDDNNTPTEKTAIIDFVSQFMEGKIPEVVSLLEEGNWLGERRTLPRLSAAVLLLSQLARLPQLAPLIPVSLTPNVFTKLLSPILELHLTENELLQKPVYSFCVEALSFLAALADKETRWLLFFVNLLRSIQVQKVLSMALLSGDCDVKKKVLALIVSSGFSSSSLDLLANEMTKMNKLVMIPAGGGNFSVQDEECKNCSGGQSKGSSSGYSTMTEVVPPLTAARLNSLLDRCEQAVRNSQEDGSLSSHLLELYGYRVEALEGVLRETTGGLEAAEARAGRLQGRLAGASAELSRVLTALRSAQTTADREAARCLSLSTELARLSAAAQETELKYSQCHQNLRSKTVIITNLNQELEDIKLSKGQMEKAMKTLEEELNTKKSECLDLRRELDSSIKAVSGLEKNISDLEAMKQKELELKNQKIDSLNKDIVELSSSIKKLKGALVEKDNQIAEYKRMQELIEMAMGRKKL